MSTELICCRQPLHNRRSGIRMEHHRYKHCPHAAAYFLGENCPDTVAADLLEAAVFSIQLYLHNHEIIAYTQRSITANLYPRTDALCVADVVGRRTRHKTFK